MNRRQFCRRMAAFGGAVALAPLASACTPAPPQAAARTPTALPLTSPTHTPPPPATQTLAPTPTPAPTEVEGAAKVALVKTTDRADGVRRAMDLLGANPVQGKRIFLKPNFNSADPAPGSTHSDVLRTLIGKLSEMGAGPLTIGDRSGMGDTRTVMQQKGVFDLATEWGFDTVVFNELAKADWVVLQDSDYHWSQGYAVPKLLLNAECVVQTCNLKTHRYGGHFTLSLKNSVGFAAQTVDSGHDYMRELHSSAYQRLMIAEINAAYSPALIVMDGVEAFVTGGPATGQIVATDVVLVGTDRVAMDAIGVAILRMFGTTPEVSQGRVFEQEQIARAVELGLGVDAPEKIEIVTADVESEAYAGEIRLMLA